MTDRPSAATPKEARIIAEWAKGGKGPGYYDPKHGHAEVFGDSLLDLVRRSMAAQREKSAQVVEAPIDPDCECLGCFRLSRAAAAIRAGE